MKKVRWTPIELDALASALAEMRVRDPLPSLMILLRDAQSVLPAERRRYSLQVMPEELVDLVVAKLAYKKPSLDSYNFMEIMEYVSKRLGLDRPIEPVKKIHKVAVAGVPKNKRNELHTLLPANISVQFVDNDTKIQSANLYVIWSSYASQLQINNMRRVAQFKEISCAGPISAVANRIKQELL